MPCAKLSNYPNIKYKGILRQQADLKINKSDIVLTGKFNENDFNLTKAEELSKQGKKHGEILKFFYKDFSLSEK